MPLPNKTELSLAQNNLTMKNLMEKQRDSIQGSGKAYSSTTTYEKYDTSIYDEIEYISIYSDGNTQHTNQQPDVSPTYWQDKRVFDNVVENSSLSTTLEDYYNKTEADNLFDDKVSKVTSTDNAIPKFNGITGEIQDTSVLIDDNDFITTQIFNQDGAEFDGVEYFDDGLRGVPDTTFSSTGARIYPDGTIRGKSSYGKYTKSPDGTLICKHRIDNGAVVYTAVGGVAFSPAFSWSYPHIFSTAPRVSATGAKQSNNFTWASVNTPEINFCGYRILQAEASASANATADFTAIGEWK